MADIVDPQALKFVNEQVRPLCEKIRALNAELAALQTNWFGGINAKFPNDASAVIDGRATDGSSRLTGADINSAVGIMINMKGASNDEIIAKPCVRVLQAT